MAGIALILAVLTEHYDIHAEGVDEADVGRMLEALHADLTKHFGRAPKEKLRVEIYKTRDAWADALKRDKQIVPEGAGGYYAPGTKKAYLYAQPSEYFTRQLILHEATHQFHYLAATGNRNVAEGWYTEGIAEYFGMHNWDGKTLKTGVVPAVTLEDYPAKALEQFDARKQDFPGLIGGTADRPEAWALFHFLMNNHRTKFKAMTPLLDQGKKAADAWKSVFGKADFGKAFREWLVEKQQPWKIVWVSWQELGDRIEGKSDVNGLAVLKKSPDRLEVEIESDALAGLVFGYKSADEFTVFQRTAGGYRVVRRKDGKWETLATGDKKGKLAATRKGELFVDGEKIGSFDAGDLGLNVDGGRALFKVVTK